MPSLLILMLLLPFVFNKVIYTQEYIGYKICDSKLNFIQATKKHVISWKLINKCVEVVI